MSFHLTDKAREMLANMKRQKPGHPWTVRSGSGARIPETKTICAQRKSGTAWLVKHRRQIVAEFSGDDARQKAKAEALRLKSIL